jgi:tRNA dimethylallyltransferase
LYYKALQQGLSKLPSADPVIRQQLSDEAEKIGWQAMHAKLAQVDSVAAQRIHPNDPQRIQRALEVYEASGKSLSEHWRDDQGYESAYEFVNVGLIPEDRAVLHERIAKRFDLMLAQGFIDEVSQLKEKYSLNLDMPSMRAVGYRQMWQYLNDEFDLDALKEKAIAATRQYAKRQLTWLRGWPDLCTVNSMALKEVQDIFACLDK